MQHVASVPSVAARRTHHQHARHRAVPDARRRSTTSACTGCIAAAVSMRRTARTPALPPCSRPGLPSCVGWTSGSTMWLVVRASERTINYTCLAVTIGSRGASLCMRESEREESEWARARARTVQCGGETTHLDSDQPEAARTPAQDRHPCNSGEGA